MKLELLLPTVTGLVLVVLGLAFGDPLVTGAGLGAVAGTAGVGGVQRVKGK